MRSTGSGDTSVHPSRAACDGCRLADSCAGGPDGGHAPFRGAVLVFASLLYFLLPAGAALLGAALAGGGAPRQLAGGAAGMLVGMLIANLAARLHPALVGREDCHEPR